LTQSTSWGSGQSKERPKWIWQGTWKITLHNQSVSPEKGTKLVCVSFILLRFTLRCLGYMTKSTLLTGKTFLLYSYTGSDKKLQLKG
jgi:hypothetical protein